MKDSYFIGIYWGVRKEDIGHCADKVKATFDLLSGFDDSFGTWYKTSRPRKGEVLQPLDTSREGVEILLQKSQNYNDIGELLEDLGYLVYLKSEKDFSKAHILSIQCGGYFETTPNSVTINIGKKEAYEHLTHNGVLEKIYNALIEIWHPVKGVIRCNDVHLLSNAFS